MWILTTLRFAKKLTKFKLSWYIVDVHNLGIYIHALADNAALFSSSLFLYLSQFWISAFSTFSLFCFKHLSAIVCFSSLFYNLKFSSVLCSVSDCHYLTWMICSVSYLLLSVCACVCMGGWVWVCIFVGVCGCVSSFFWPWGSEVSLFCCHFSALKQVSLLEKREKMQQLQKVVKVLELKKG